MQEKGPEDKKMIQLQSGKRIRLYSAGNLTPKIYFDKFEDFNIISTRLANWEL